MSGKDSIHVAIASGGTGGHFYPSLAIAEAVREAGDHVTLLLAGKHVGDQLRLAAERQLNALPVPACRLPGRNPVAALAFLWRFGRARRLARKWAAKERPDVILGMGSFASAPTCLGGVAAGVPLVLHEGNAWMGRANRWLSRFASMAATSLPLVPECPCRCPQTQTGMPLRKAIIEAAAKPAHPPGFWAETGLAPGVPTVLVFGGSLGAEAINTLLIQSLPSIGSDVKRLQFIHLTGSPYNEGIADAYRQAGACALVKRYDPNIEQAYLAADIVICRAGASSICELALFGKPAILIPLPTAAEDHQTANARSLAACGAAWLLPQEEAKPEMLADLLGDFLRSPETWRDIGQRIRAYARPDATERVVQVLRDHARNAGDKQ